MILKVRYTKPRDFVEPIKWSQTRSLVLQLLNFNSFQQMPHYYADVPRTTTAWTDQMHRHIVKFIAAKNPSLTGRSSRILWTNLVDAFPHEHGHSQIAWESRYANHKPYFDREIEKHLKLIGYPQMPLLPHPHPKMIRKRFTREEQDRLISLVALNDPDGKRRRTNAFYGLLNDGPTTRHSERSWLTHYTKFSDFYDYMIQKYQRENGLSVTPGVTSLVGIKMPANFSLSDTQQNTSSQVTTAPSLGPEFVYLGKRKRNTEQREFGSNGVNSRDEPALKKLVAQVESMQPLTSAENTSQTFTIPKSTQSPFDEYLSQLPATNLYPFDDDEIVTHHRQSLPTEISSDSGETTDPENDIEYFIRKVALDKDTHMNNGTGSDDDLYVDSPPCSTTGAVPSTLSLFADEDDSKRISDDLYNGLYADSPCNSDSTMVRSPENVLQISSRANTGVTRNNRAMHKPTDSKATVISKPKKTAVSKIPIRKKASACVASMRDAGSFLPTPPISSTDLAETEPQQISDTALNKSGAQSLSLSGTRPNPEEPITVAEYNAKTADSENDISAISSSKIWVNLTFASLARLAQGAMF
ncbi:hypothetical protein VKT23_017820 [Stygiomarasmius scandens]|uniref:Uncharacterized protein n=1 Tax=Marasmiellus scandens TaxID=2682957 RepID=A0ABR1ITB8_9AGAR